MPLFSDPWAPAKAALLHLMSSGALPSGGGPSAVESGFSGAPSGSAPAWLKQLSGQGQTGMGFDPGSVTGGGTPSFVPGSVTGGSGGPVFAPGSVTGGITPGSGGANPGGGVYAPFGGPNADSPPAWLAKAALAAFQSGNTKYRDHLLADPTIAGDPHLRNFITGLFAGDADRLREAQYYATNPSYNGWNNAAGDGIAGDGR